MIKTRALLSLTFVLLTAACGTYTDKSQLPPSAPPKPNTPEPTTLEPDTAAPPITMWYERYDLGNIVVKVGPGVADGRNKDQAVGIDRNSRASDTKSGVQAYERRLQVLQQERERLLRENAVLQEQAERQADADFQAREGLLELRSQLARLSAQQDDVNSQAQMIVEEHGALLELVGSPAPDKLAQSEGR